MTPVELGKLRILIVDSNVFVAKTLFSILEEFGVAKIITCHSLEDAEKIFSTYAIDCIFVDFMIDNRAGLEFIKKLRTEKSSKNPASIPVVLITGFTDIDTITMARDAGVNEVVGKPFSAAHILLKLGSAIRNDREFIDVEEYVGPNRRRQRSENSQWAGKNDRRARPEPVVDSREIIWTEDDEERRKEERETNKIIIP